MFRNATEALARMLSACIDLPALQMARGGCRHYGDATPAIAASWPYMTHVSYVPVLRPIFDMQGSRNKYS